MKVSAHIQVKGCVQGVGFRPFVRRLAASLSLDGSVWNQHSDVIILAVGEKRFIKTLIKLIQSDNPPNASISNITVNWSHDAPQTGNGFHIVPSPKEDSESAGKKLQNLVSHLPGDTALCRECLKELFDPDNRRYHYPFVGCLNCGPRESLIYRLPFERHNTSMAEFTQCSHCTEEYAEAGGRREHLQSNCCPRCGPHYTAKIQHDSGRNGDSSFNLAANYLRGGQVVALKGYSGYHLFANAHEDAVIEKLRTIKQRPDKPFALMVLNRESAVKWGDTSLSDSLLSSASAPIVTLPKSLDSEERFPLIAPGLKQIGLMLAYSPAHYLLFHSLLGNPQGSDWLERPNDIALICTSANTKGAPLNYQFEQASPALFDLADLVLDHNRKIVSPADDSVIQGPLLPCGLSPKEGLKIRRSRGLSSETMNLYESLPSSLALGAYLKGTITTISGAQAFVSHHLGEASSKEARNYIQAAIAHQHAVHGITPELIACDSHPDFYTTQLAEAISKIESVPLYRIQHHEAHFAAALAEMHSQQPETFVHRSLGLVLDGFGLGPDTQLWGGELFLSDQMTMTHLGQLERASLPGGDQAAKEPWRVAAGLLERVDPSLLDRFLSEHSKREQWAHLRRVEHPVTSSMGRWFDAVAALGGICLESSYEGQAAMMLEHQALGNSPLTPEGLVYITEKNQLALSRLFHSLAKTTSPDEISRRFHDELIEGLAKWVLRNAKEHRASSVCLSGGCFQNQILRAGLTNRLELNGLQCFIPSAVPLNDGGVSLGQAYLAAHRHKQNARYNARSHQCKEHSQSCA